MNLRRRGYPADKLKLFATMVQYGDRVSVLHNSVLKRQERDIPLLIPSRYNEVWNYIHLQDVFELMLDGWQESGR